LLAGGEKEGEAARMPHRHSRIASTQLSPVFSTSVSVIGSMPRSFKRIAWQRRVSPGDTPHFHWARSGEYVSQVTAIGPLGLEFIDSKDDLRNAADLACYASLVRFSDPSLVRANVRRTIDAGFRSLKLHEIKLSPIRAAREEAGPDVEIMLDVNCAWTLKEARARAEELKELDLKWLEEPVWPSENCDGVARLGRTWGIPIAAGENVSTLSRRLLLGHV
jgi:Enolase C-terminal domain-like